MKCKKFLAGLLGCIAGVSLFGMTVSADGLCDFVVNIDGESTTITSTDRVTYYDARTMVSPVPIHVIEYVSDSGTMVVYQYVTQVTYHVYSQQSVDSLVDNPDTEDIIYKSVPGTMSRFNDNTSVSFAGNTYDMLGWSRIFGSSVAIDGDDSDFTGGLMDLYPILCNETSTQTAYDVDVKVYDYLLGTKEIEYSLNGTPSDDNHISVVDTTGTESYLVNPMIVNSTQTHYMYLPSSDLTAGHTYEVRVEQNDVEVTVYSFTVPDFI